MIKAVVFDLDGVFFKKGTAEFLSKISSIYNISRDNVASVYLKSNQMQKYKKGLIDSSEYWNYFVDTLDIDASENILIEILLECYEVDQQVIDLLKKLKEKGVKLAVCTNNFPERLAGLENKFRLRTYFDVIVTSYEVGVTKPDPEIFKVLSEKLELHPSEILMSDDREENVNALKENGFKAVLYTSWDHFFQLAVMNTESSIVPDDLSGRFTEDIDYSMTSDGSIWGPASEETIKFIFDNVKPDELWIDLACGDGRYTSILAENVQEVVATDIDGSALGKLLYLLPVELRDKVSVNRFDLLEKFPFEDNSVDGIFSAGTLYLFQKVQFAQICKEISRVIIERGTVLLEFAVNIRRVDPEGKELIFGNEPLYNKESAISIIQETLPQFDFEFTDGEKVHEHADSNPSYEFYSDTLLVKGIKK